ncbi:MAG: LON peptidase substrate-binding domain-containing protein [Spirochaetales bacterium]|nr:LON peptidase substrate-binding domain-containing protein [Spirochaetales bacterium]MCF7938519.1 LON peptidase substrate-binding domain-containing protein [Spirochaetales bacterium]
MRVPLFPLNLVLFPGVLLPLHIFEERYRIMLQEVLDGDELFAIVRKTRTHQEDIGCLARVETVAKEYDDGRSDILTTGTDRFKIKEVYDDKPYLTADIEILEETDGTANDEELAHLQQSTINSLEDLFSLQKKRANLEKLASKTPRDLSYTIAGLDIFSTQAKQRLLQSPTVAARLDTIMRLLEEKTEKVKTIVRLQEVLETKQDVSLLFN